MCTYLQPGQDKHIDLVSVILAPPLSCTPPVARFTNAGGTILSVGGEETALIEVALGRGRRLEVLLEALDAKDGVERFDSPTG